jgi:hypothetical protein
MGTRSVRVPGQTTPVPTGFANPHPCTTIPSRLHSCPTAIIMQQEKGAWHTRPERDQFLSIIWSTPCPAFWEHPLSDARKAFSSRATTSDCFSSKSTKNTSLLWKKTGRFQRKTAKVGQALGLLGFGRTIQSKVLEKKNVDAKSRIVLRRLCVKTIGHVPCYL